MSQTKQETVIPLLRLGLFGWRSGFSDSGIFPDDLPDDWRLTYLSNMVDRIVIPFETFNSADVDEIKEWEEDTHEQLGFFLSLSSSELSASSKVTEEEILKKLKLLQGKWLGVVLYGDDNFQYNFSSNIPVFRMVELSVDDPLMEVVVSLQGGDGVALLHASRELMPMEMRSLIELLKNQDIDTLIFVPAPGLGSNLDNAEVISSLLG